jgi:hypothetical protein
LSGTGAVRLAAEVLTRFRKAPVYISDPTWGNHMSLFGDAQMEVRRYKYWNAATKGLDVDGFFGTMEVICVFFILSSLLPMVPSFCCILVLTILRVWILLLNNGKKPVIL